MITLNTQPAIREMNKLCYEYKRTLKKKELYLFNANLYNLDFGFHKWLKFNKGIKDLNAYLSNIALNTSRKSLYLKRSKGRQIIINR